MGWWPAPAALAAQFPPRWIPGRAPGALRPWCWCRGPGGPGPVATVSAVAVGESASLSVTGRPRACWSSMILGRGAQPAWAGGLRRRRRRRSSRRDGSPAGRRRAAAMVLVSRSWWPRTRCRRELRTCRGVGFYVSHWPAEGPRVPSGPAIVRPGRSLGAWAQPAWAGGLRRRRWRRSSRRDGSPAGRRRTAAMVLVSRSWWPRTRCRRELRTCRGVGFYVSHWPAEGPRVPSGPAIVRPGRSSGAWAHPAWAGGPRRHHQRRPHRSAAGAPGASGALRPWCWCRGPGGPGPVATVSAVAVGESASLSVTGRPRACWSSMILGRVGATGMGWWPAPAALAAHSSRRDGSPAGRRALRPWCWCRGPAGPGPAAAVSSAPVEESASTSLTGRRRSSRSSVGRRSCTLDDPWAREAHPA